jgi:hypothetical protein
VVKKWFNQQSLCWRGLDRSWTTRRRILGAWPEAQHHHDFTERVDRHPEPERVRPAAQPRAQFIELSVRQV